MADEGTRIRVAVVGRADGITRVQLFHSCVETSDLRRQYHVFVFLLSCSQPCPAVIELPTTPMFSARSAGFARPGSLGRPNARAKDLGKP